MNKTLDTSYY